MPLRRKEIAQDVERALAPLGYGGGHSKTLYTKSDATLSSMMAPEAVFCVFADAVLK